MSHEATRLTYSPLIPQLDSILLGGLSYGLEFGSNKPLLKIFRLEAGAQRLGRLLMAGLPLGKQLRSCNLQGLPGSALPQGGTALLAGLRELRLEGCSHAGGMDAPLTALLQLCGPNLTRLALSPGQPAQLSLNMALRAFPPALAACAQLRNLALRNGAGSLALELPPGPYLAGTAEQS